MMLKQKIRLLVLCLFFSHPLLAQTALYPYQRTLSGVGSNWHSLRLPNDVFAKAQNTLADLRIYGIKGKDTIEVPYLLEQSANQLTEKETPFGIINQSSNNNGYYYTFQSASAATINQIRLFFAQQNFDWKIDLSGSNNNTEWFNILEDYRILSIKNNSTDYHFTQLNFPTAKYRYFRLQIKTNEKPTLRAAKILKADTLKGLEQDILPKSYHLLNDAKNKLSIIEVSLPNRVPLSYLKLNMQNDLDFYRSLKIEYATDSFKTDKGIQYQYNHLYEGSISSLESPIFRFNGTMASQLRITIQNNDNKALRLNGIALKGPVYELVARFEKTDYQYALYYGNTLVEAPVYELKNFENKIPIDISTLALGQEQPNPNFKASETKAALFENKAWLWGLIILIIALLGFFTYKMLR